MPAVLSKCREHSAERQRNKLLQEAKRARAGRMRFVGGSCRWKPPLRVLRKILVESFSYAALVLAVLDGNKRTIFQTNQHDDRECCDADLAIICLRLFSGWESTVVADFSAKLNCIGVVFWRRQTSAIICTQGCGGGTKEYISFKKLLQVWEYAWQIGTRYQLV